MTVNLDKMPGVPKELLDKIKKSTSEELKKMLPRHQRIQEMMSTRATQMMEQADEARILVLASDNIGEAIEEELLKRQDGSNIYEFKGS